MIERDFDALLQQHRRIFRHFDPQCRGDGLALGDDAVHDPANLFVQGGPAVRQTGQRTQRVACRVEDQFGPLGTAGVGQRQGVHAAPGQDVRELFDLVGGGGLRLERPDPRVARRVELHDTGGEDPARGKRRPPDHAGHVLRNGLLVADSVLHRAHRAVGERVGRRLDGRRRVHALGGDDAVVEGGQVARIGRRRRMRRDLLDAGEPQAVLVDGRHVVGVDVVDPHLDVV